MLSNACVCIKYVVNRVNFAAAEAACASQGSAKVFMTDSQEKIDLVKQIAPTENVWVGLTDREQEGVYKWVDGRTTTTEQMALFKHPEPNDMNGAEDCTHIWAGNYNYLNDHQCEKTFSYICEIPIK